MWWITYDFRQDLPSSVLSSPIQRIRSWIISYNNIFFSYKTNQQYWLIIHDRFGRNEHAAGIKHLSQANKRRTESRGVSVPEQLIRSCSCREVSVRVLCSVFGLQLTVSLGDSRVWSPPKDVTIGYRTDIVQGDVHSHLSSPVSRFQL